MLNLDNIVSNKKKSPSEYNFILMKIINKKQLISIAEENSGHLDYFRHLNFLKIYNYCTNKPYSFMMVDTRPIARVTFKKNFNEPIDL